MHFNFSIMHCRTGVQIIAWSKSENNINLNAVTWHCSYIIIVLELTNS